MFILAQGKHFCFLDSNYCLFIEEDVFVYLPGAGLNDMPFKVNILHRNETTNYGTILPIKSRGKEKEEKCPFKRFLFFLNSIKAM